jgi:hypothetical protein
VSGIARLVLDGLRAEDYFAEPHLPRHPSRQYRTPDPTGRQAAAMAFPEDLDGQVRALLDKESALSWEQALVRLPG